MTVPSQTSRDSQAGNGVTLAFTVPFRILEQTHIRVLLTVAGVTTEQVLTTNYTVSNVGEASTTVTFLVAPASGSTITFLRNVPFTQETDYVPNDPFPAESHERALDKLTMEVQQLSEAQDRALTLPESVSGVSAVLPAPVASNLIGWNGAADGLRNFTVAEIGTTLAFSNFIADTFTATAGQVNFTLTEDPGNLANLDVSIDGVTQVPTTDYTVAGTTLTFTAAMVGGEKVLARYGTALPTGITDASSVNYTPPSTGVAGSVRSFLDSLWTAGASAGAALIRFLQAGTGAVARTAQDKMRDIVSVKDFGAVGDGVADDTAAINAAIAAMNAVGGGSVFFPRGTYMAAGILVLSNVRLYGEGEGSVIKAISTLANTSALCQNPNTGTFTDNNIAVENLVFDGNDVGAGGTQVRFTSLVQFVRVTGVRISGVTVRNVQYIGLSLSSSRRGLVDGCRFTTCGYAGTTTNAGPALFIASVSTDYPSDFKIVGCEFFSNRWHGLHLSVQRGVVSGCTFRLNQEAHIFSSRLLPNVLAEEIAIVGNVFDDVTKHDISSSAIEVEIRNGLIANNIIRNCDHAGMSLTRCQNMTVTGNTISNVNRLGITAGGIDLICNGTGADKLKNVTITSNRIYDDQATVTTRHAVRAAGTGDNAENCLIENNDFSGTVFTSGSALDMVGKGAAIIRRNNLGSTDDFPVPKIVQFQPGTVAGNLAITGVGFKPSRLEFVAVVASSTSALTSHSHIGKNLLGAGITSAADGAAARATATTNKCWSIVSPATGAVSAEATLVSMDADGFTVNLVTVANDPWVTCVAHP